MTKNKMPDNMSLFLLSPKNAKEGHLSLEDGESHHLLHVLRKKSGDRITLSFGQGEAFEAQIVKEGPPVVLEILSKKKSLETEKPTILLAPALLKGPRMDWLIEKATELGASQIIPLLTERGVVKAKTAADRIGKIKRWERVSQAALKQSERNWLPRIGPLLTFYEFLERFKESQGLKILFTIPGKETPPLKKLEEILKPHHNVRLLMPVIGPEGGFSTKEIKMAVEAGFQFSSLGNHTLRAETAAISALSILQHLVSQSLP